MCTNTYIRVVSNVRNSRNIEVVKLVILADESISVLYLNHSKDGMITRLVAHLKKSLV